MNLVIETKKKVVARSLQSVDCFVVKICWVILHHFELLLSLLFHWGTVCYFRQQDVWKRTS